MALANHCSILGGIHAGEVKHGNVWLAVVIHCEVQRWELVIGGEVSSLTGIHLQCILVHIPPREKQLGVCKVLGHKQRMSSYDN